MLHQSKNSLAIDIGAGVQWRWTQWGADGEKTLVASGNMQVEVVEVVEVMELHLVVLFYQFGVQTPLKNVNGHCWPSMHEYDGQYDSDIARLSPYTKW